MLGSVGNCAVCEDFEGMLMWLRQKNMICPATLRAAARISSYAPGTLALVAPGSRLDEIYPNNPGSDIIIVIMTARSAHLIRPLVLLGTLAVSAFGFVLYQVGTCRFGRFGPFSAAPQTSHLSKQTGYCSIADYMDGSWHASDESQVRPGYRFCQIDARQDCRKYASENAEYLRKTWVPRKPRCHLRQLTPEQVKQCLANQTVAFLGDSLARNQHHSFQCMLLDGPQTVLPVMDGFKSSYATSYPETNTHIHWRSNNFVRPMDVAKLTNDTIIVVGTGPHWAPIMFGFNTTQWNDWSQLPGGIPAAKGLVRSAIRATIQAFQELPPSIRVIWRLPDLSHTSAPRSGNPWFHECAPFLSSWNPRSKKLPWEDATQWIYDAVHEYSVGTRIELMDVMSMSGTRPDGHPSAHLNRTRDGLSVHDCQHWCLPGIPDAWNEVLINYLCHS